MKRVIIVGGVAGGASAATRLRRMKEDIEIIMLDKGSYVSFANCGLPYYIGNIIKERESLELVTPQEFKDRFNIDVRVNNEVISINREKKSVFIKDLEKNSGYELSYDYLILSPGAEPIKPPFPGINEVPLFTLRTIPDAVAIRQYVEENMVKHAVIIGGGFIGLEIAENLREKGIKVKIVEMLDQVMAPLDKEMAQFVHHELILNGVCLVLDDAVDSFGRNDKKIPHVKTKSGRVIETDMVILAIGVRPESKLAKDANLKLGPKGHIVVNKYMQTSDPSIYAVGDAIQVTNFQSNQMTALALAGPANKQGRIAADNIAGHKSEFKGVLGTSVVKIFDMTVATVGLNEKSLKNIDITYDKIYLHPNNHAGYYPGAIPTAFKLIYEVPSGKVLGVQAIGGNGSEKRIDVVSTVIKFGGTVFDLEELELSYAPPFNSAKDPVNMAGFIAANSLRGDHLIWQWDQVDEIMDKGLLLDVRTVDEYKLGTIGDAINIPDKQLRDRMNEIPKDKPIYAFCQAGYRGYLAQRTLVQNGFKNVYNLTGGYKIYELANTTLEELISACGSPQEIMEEMVKEKSIENAEFMEINCSGLSCPGPLNAMIKALEVLPENKKLRVIATDIGFKSSVEAYAKLTDGIELLSLEKDKGSLIATIEKRKVAGEDIQKPVMIEKRPRKQMRKYGPSPLSEIVPEELYERLDSIDAPDVLIDVRTPEEYYGLMGHVKGSKLIPLDQLMNKINNLNEYKDKEVVTICHSGARSNMAARLLVQNGFTDVRNLTGGMLMWRKKGLPITSE
ncbi:MAG: pyridine nucleotide-disulfide oxidoreductase [Candidatus Lokiarchaeota archaeon]|nr:pyridine nucleotide-disulfide oxidoreductase [Candidatus Lokiarchaeota archaeon]